MIGETLARTPRETWIRRGFLSGCSHCGTLDRQLHAKQLCKSCYGQKRIDENRAALNRYHAAWSRRRKLERLAERTLRVLAAFPERGVALRVLRSDLGPLKRRHTATVRDVQRLLTGRVLALGVGRRERWKLVGNA